jgi:hypothetical protein
MAMEDIEPVQHEAVSNRKLQWQLTSKQVCKHMGMVWYSSGTILATAKIRYKSFV